MADNYLQFSEGIDGLTPAECEWIETVLRMDTDDEELLTKLKDELALEGDVDLCCWPGFEWKIEPDKDGNHTVWLYGDDYGNLDHVSWFISAFIHKFRPDMIFTLTWAETCSKPLLGEFGGGFLVVGKDDIVCENAWTQAQRAAAAMQNSRDKAPVDGQG